MQLSKPKSGNAASSWCTSNGNHNLCHMAPLVYVHRSPHYFCGGSMAEHTCIRHNCRRTCHSPRLPTHHPTRACSWLNATDEWYMTECNASPPPQFQRVCTLGQAVSLQLKLRRKDLAGTSLSCHHPEELQPQSWYTCQQPPPFAYHGAAVKVHLSALSVGHGNFPSQKHCLNKKQYDA